MTRVSAWGGSNLASPTIWLGGKGATLSSPLRPHEALKLEMTFALQCRSTAFIAESAHSVLPCRMQARQLSTKQRRPDTPLSAESPVLPTPARVQAELLQQFALLQQADVEAKRRQEHDHSTSVSMHGSILGEIEEMRQQLGSVISSRDSTQQLLRQVLGEVQELRLQQQQVDSRTAEAVQHAMAAAASAEAVQRQQGALSDEIKVREHVLPCCSLESA